MSSSLKWFLPELEIKGSLPEPQKSGEWTLIENYDLNRLANDLKVVLDIREIKVKSEIKTSIPDVWAYPVLLKMALLDERHHLHNKCKSEWRGILALLALREEMNLPISFKSIPVRNLPSILAVSFDDKTKVGEIHVILYNENPVGILAPSTLVCPAVDLVNRIDSGAVPWFNGVEISDPVKHLNPLASTVLLRWLEEVRESVKNHVAEGIVREINRYIDDIKNKSMQIRITFKSASEIEGIFEAIGKPGKIEDIFSETFIFNEGKKTKTRWILADKSVQTALNKPAEDIIIYNCFNLKQDEFIRSFSTNEIKIVSKNNIFLNKLYLLRQKIDGLEPIKDRKLKDVYPILPLKGEVLEQFSPSYILNNLKYEYKGDSVEFTLSLEITSNLYNGKKKVDIRREYSYDKNEIQIVEDFPIVEVWPKISDSVWKPYYLFIHNIHKSWHGISLKPFPEPEESISYGENLIKIYKFSTFPEAVICVDSKENEIGLILTKPNLIKPNLHKKRIVSIDLGTVNTMIFMKEDEGEEFKFEFKGDLFLHSVIGADESEREKSLFVNFIPPRKIEVPISSLYHVFEGEKRGAIRPLLDGHIYFLGDVFREVYFGRIVQNLKWEIDPDDREKLEAFLSEIFFHIIVSSIHDGVKEIEFRYAYPSAFSRDDEKYYHAFFGRVVDSIRENLSGVNLIIKKPETESISSAKFFETTETGLVCIDIGGGTTDISVWQKNNLVYQTSILFAGRDIFERCFFDPVFSKVRNDIYDKTNLEVNIELSDTNKIKVLQVLQKNSEEVFKELVKFRDKIEFEQFLFLLKVGMYGLIYYVAKILRYLVENNKYDLKRFPPKVVLSGNGTKILRWISYGLEDYDEEKIRRILESQIPGSSVEIEVSKNPKEEVARGLLKDFDISGDGNAEQNRIYISGVEFEVSGKWYKPNESLTVDMYKNINDVKISELEEFYKHVKKLSNKGYYIDINNGDWRNIRMNIVNKLSRYRNVEEEKLRIEPLFTFGLKEIVDYLIKNNLAKKQAS